MDEIIKERLDLQEQKIDAIYLSVEKTRKYLLIIMWSSVLMIILPLLAGMIIIPIVISTFSGIYGGLL